MPPQAIQITGRRQKRSSAPSETSSAWHATAAAPAGVFTRIAQRLLALARQAGMRGLRCSWRGMSAGVLAGGSAAVPEEVPLGVCWRHVGGTLVGGGGFAFAAQAAKQIGARG